MLDDFTELSKEQIAELMSLVEGQFSDTELTWGRDMGKGFLE